MRTISKMAGLAATLAALSFTAHADPTAVRIRLVEADLQQASIRLEGMNFAALGATTNVYLVGHEQPLKMYRLTENEVRASLPARLESGTYVVRVTRDAQAHEAPLTVGIVGPVVQDN